VAKKVVAFADVRKMLETCAPGARIDEKLHQYWVTYQGKSFRTLPRGDHAHRGHKASGAGIEFGYVRSLVRHLEIDCPCARELFPDLKCDDEVEPPR
jgi:hypothetical protein